MNNSIKLLKDNENIIKEDVEWVEEFYLFLQGDIPEGLHLQSKPRLSAKKAFSVIYYLQEHLPVFPDFIEVCWSCGELFKSDDGIYWETKERHYCSGCSYLVPENYDKGLVRSGSQE